ncbi:hypothetical protein EG68_02846 [Paragonimus skrjabini miyazakii]|uniref:PIN domain-containing protein n=1 Tax=Paragonimus skrjabini miyazakii TaxID=59628 RepID=A0A8S9Z1U8_9TREM|nr:hypothetical protein EG68_02846 [Paragonimus skrjabini miyazakii]
MCPDADDRTRVLLKAASDSIKRLDSIYANGKAIKTVFSYEAYGYRLRLKETLQKLMFTDPANHARRAEELIWRKVFYEPLNMYKIYVKNNDRPDRVADFELALKVHLLSGIGYYQSILLQMQSENFSSIRKNFCAWLPVAFHIPLQADSTFEFDLKNASQQQTNVFDERMMQKCLMYIGDLFRYLLDFGEFIGKAMAYGYYNAAINLDPSVGLLHNQLGILDVGRCYGLNAIFHYLKCLCAPAPFEGARRNLQMVLVKNELRYRKLFGEKPIFGLYSRRPNRYRPKDFRKTITKFIFLIQCFLKLHSSEYSGGERYVPQVFQDTLFELHLMLTVSSESVLEPEVTTDHSGHLVNITSGDANRHSSIEDAELRRDSSLFSERLTGPIFIRIILIAVLTANLRLCETASVSNRSSEAKTVNEPPVPVSNPSDGNSDVTDVKSDDDTAKTVNDTNSQTDQSEQTSTDVLDSFGPLFFLLQLSELYMSHVTKQLNDQLVDQRGAYNVSVTCPRNDVSRVVPRTSIEQDVDQGEQNDEEDDKIGEHTMTNTFSGKRVPPKALSDSFNSPTAEEDIETDRSSCEGMDSSVIRKSLPDDPDSAAEDRAEEDEDIVDRVEDDGEDEFEYSDETESNADLWSSDDSSLLHSQDEMLFSGASADEDEQFADHRLRRARLHKASSRRSNQAANRVQTGFADADVPAVDCDLRYQTKSSLMLDPIREEELVSEGKLHQSRQNRKRKLPTCPVEKMRTKPESGYSKRMHARRTDVDDYWLPEPCLESNAAPSIPRLSSSSDIIARAHAISRLYLLASIKLVLEWVQQEHFWPLRLVTAPLISDSPSSTQETNSIRYAVDRWCTQLGLLLNSLYPVASHIENELLTAVKGNESETVTTTDSSKNPLQNPQPTESLLVNRMSEFGVRTVECGVVARVNDSAVDVGNTDDKDRISCKSTQIGQTFPLPEDWLLRGLPSLAYVHGQLSFNEAVLSVPFTRLDEAVLRSICLVSVGRHLACHGAELGIGFVYEKTERQPFVFTPVDCDSLNVIHTHVMFSRYHRHTRRNRGRGFSSRGYGRLDYSGPHASRGSGGRWACRGASRREHYRFTSSSSRYSGRSTESFSSIKQTKVCRDDQELVPIDYKCGPKRKHTCTRKPTEDQSTILTSAIHTGVRTQSGECPDVTGSAEQSSNSSLPLIGHSEEADTNISEVAEPCIEQDLPAETTDSRKEQLMRDMARLRLLNEVDELARKCQNPSPRSIANVALPSSSTTTNVFSGPNRLETSNDPMDQHLNEMAYDASRNFVSPYLVLDAYCLSSHLPAVKQLVNSGTFVLIIPVAVISHLDYLKKTMATARVAIRYLEHETHSGNRFLRLQRPEEQPAEPTQTLRLVSARRGTQSGLSESEATAEDSSVESNRSANPRVVKRWLSILDCATYFSKLKHSENPTHATDEHTPSPSQPLSEPDPQSNQSGPCNTLTTEPSSCCDLLALGKLSTESDFDHQTRTALVTILIGSRDVVSEDMFVPREFIQLVHKCGVRLELLRDFVTRWRRMRKI